MKKASTDTQCSSLQSISLKVQSEVKNNEYLFSIQYKYKKEVQPKYIKKYDNSLR